MLPNKDDFFRIYPNIDLVKFENSLMKWEDIIEIYDDYNLRKDEFEEQAELIFKKISKFKKVNSCKHRVKDPEHLIEKIIRKTQDGQERITRENYVDRIQDIIGIRAIHLYKEDWDELNSMIHQKWENNLSSGPIAHIRVGDSPEFIKAIKERDGTVNVHPYGYRSIHYILCIKVNELKYYMEIQTRSIFEEGWSEIDHDIRYPYQVDNPLYNNYLGILNRFAGASDEMATMLKFLDKDQNEKISQIERLNDVIENQNFEISLQKELDHKRIDGIQILLNQMVKLNLSKASEESLRQSLKRIRSNDIDPKYIAIVENTSFWIKLNNFFRNIKSFFKKLIINN
jgi:ppGpp synthetase/RelA/SpoT-type nucleotidyltranferase